MRESVFEFEHNGFIYVLTDDGKDYEGKIVRYTKWNNKGQQVDAGLVKATNFTEAKHIIKGE